MKLGKLDRRIRIERDGAPTHNGYQNVSGEPVTVATVWAQWMPGVGRERFANDENVATAPGVFVIRWSSRVRDVSPLDRVEFEGRMYDIGRVEEIGRRVGLRIFATARAE
jgi:head-tail adaptor